jgi:hypothetical protein
MPYTPEYYRNEINTLSFDFDNHLNHYNSKTNVDIYGNTSENIDYPIGCKDYNTNITSFDKTDCKEDINSQASVISKYKTFLKILTDELSYDFGIIFKDVEQNNIDIKVNNDKNVKLKQDYSKLMNNVNAAKGQYNDMQLRHNQLYYANILILSCIIGGTVFYSRTRNL